MCYSHACVGSAPSSVVVSAPRSGSEARSPGLRVLLTAAVEIFAAAVETGRTVIWLHTFGERFADPKRGRLAGQPRMPKEVAPGVPAAGAISQDPAEMPDSIDYEKAKRRLLIGFGYVENVPPEVWDYEVSGKHVLRQWFGYRKANRDRPIIGDRRPPSKLGDIQPDRWPAEYTTELINLLNVLGLLVNLEPSQAELLERVCAGQTISLEELHAAGALGTASVPTPRSGTCGSPNQLGLLD